MKTIFSATLIAIALSLAAAAQAADGKTGDRGASSVADMLQRKHDTELRAEFVREGRWADVQKLDDAAALHLQAQREQRFLHMNEDLAHKAGADSQPIDARALDCDPDTTHVR